MMDRDSMLFYQGTELMQLSRRVDRFPVSAQFHLYTDGKRKKVLFGIAVFCKQLA